MTHHVKQVHTRTERRDDGHRACEPADHDGFRPSVPGCSHSQRPQAGETCSNWLAPRAAVFPQTVFDEIQTDLIQPNLTRPLPRRSQPIQADPTPSKPIQAHEAQKNKKTRVYWDLLPEFRVVGVVRGSNFPLCPRQ